MPQRPHSTQNGRWRDRARMTAFGPRPAFAQCSNSVALVPAIFGSYTAAYSLWNTGLRPSGKRIALQARVRTLCSRRTQLFRGFLRRLVSWFVLVRAGIDAIGGRLFGPSNTLRSSRRQLAALLGDRRALLFTPGPSHVQKQSRRGRVPGGSPKRWKSDLRETLDSAFEKY
jgi:hypothetical protein